MRYHFDRCNAMAMRHNNKSIMKNVSITKYMNHEITK